MTNNNWERQGNCKSSLVYEYSKRCSGGKPKRNKTRVVSGAKGGCQKDRVVSGAKGEKETEGIQRRKGVGK